MRHFLLYCVISATLLLSSCDFIDHGFLAPAGPVAEVQRGQFWLVTRWTIVVIMPLFVAMPIVLWKYRSGKRNAVYRPNWTFSWLLESLIWGVPLVIVGILSWNLWRATHILDPYSPIAGDEPALHIQVISLDWKWLFIYPEQQVASVNFLALPVNRPIHFELTSETVMQSFMIPRLGSQIYTMPGMETQLHLLASKPGEYRGQNTQYNGKFFAKQKFTAHAITDAEFKRWIKQQQSQPPLNMDVYNQLAQRSVLKEPKFFGSVPRNFFSQIIERVKNTPAALLPGAVNNTRPGG